MAEAKVRLQIGRVWLEIDAVSVKDAMSKLGEYQEVFCERTCGHCASEDLFYEHRQVDGHDYYSMKCRACGHQLDFGQHKNGTTLFAKRKLPNGDWDTKNRGWYFWKDRQQQESPPVEAPSEDNAPF